MTAKKFSVVIPSFNQARYLEDTIRSVLDQNYPELELIVIDGGSTDGSVEIIRKYEAAITYWVSEPDGGQTAGLVKGFSKATGEYQCWLNSDDQHMPWTLSEAANYLDTHPDIDAVFGNALWIDAEGQPIREQREIPFNRFIWMYTYNYIPGQSMFWRKSIYDRVGGLNPEFNLAMDADLWDRFASVGRIGHVRRIWSRMRFYEEQKNRALRDQSDLEDLKIRMRHWGGDYPRFYKLKKAVAQSIRVGWKFLTGCYPPGYRRYMEKI